MPDDKFLLIVQALLGYVVLGRYSLHQTSFFVYLHLILHLPTQKQDDAEQAQQGKNSKAKLSFAY
jgi:hypothetical protein